MKTSRILLVGAAFAIALPLAFAHPAVEGGLKHGFAVVKGLYGSHIELVADPKAGEVRMYISEAQDEKLADGKDHEWVINMACRTKKVGKEELSLLPMRDPGAGAEWFPVTPVEARGGYVFYRVEAAAKIMLDGDAARRHTLALTAGKDPRGFNCLKAAIDLSKAGTIRFEEVTVTVLDAKKARAPWTKKCFADTAWGLGKLHKGVPQTDFALKLFEEYVAKTAEMDKFRKPEAPAVPKARR